MGSPVQLRWTGGRLRRDTRVRRLGVGAGRGGRLASSPFRVGEAPVRLRLARGPSRRRLLRRSVGWLGLVWVDGRPGWVGVEALPGGQPTSPSTPSQDSLVGWGRVGRVGDGPGTEPTDHRPTPTPAPPFLPMPGVTPQPTQPIHPSRTYPVRLGSPPSPAFSPLTSPTWTPAYSAAGPSRWWGGGWSCQLTDWLAEDVWLGLRFG